MRRRRRNGKGRRSRSKAGPLKANQMEIGVDDGLSPQAADDSADTEEGSKRELAGGPTIRVCSRRRNCEQHKSGNRTQNGAHGKGEKCAGEAEPGGEQGHELGVAKADALAVADEFVEPTDEQDEAAGGENADEFPKCKAVDKMLLQPLRAVFAKNGI